jgi:DNA polymerase-3 subunit alpha
MPVADYIHLRVHSAYSLSEGAIKIPELIDLCLANDMPAVAITDTGNLFGALEFAVTTASRGVQPIVGCLLGLRRTVELGRNGVRPPPDRLPLLVKSEAGYRALMGLVSRAYLEAEPGEAPQLSLGDLEGHTDGLIAFTGGPTGPVGRLLADGQDDAAETTLEMLARLFPEHLYVELMRHGLDDEIRTEPRIVELAYAYGLPLVATNDAYFADEAMCEAHDALLCIAESAYVSQAERRRVTPDHRFKTAAEMAALFKDLPEAIANTLVVAQRCAFMPEKLDPILPAFPTRNGRSEADELRDLAAAGLDEQLESHVYTADMDEAARAVAAEPYRERLRYELDVIVQMGFPGYFLIVADFIGWAKQQGIPVGPGRGSGAGSVVAWSLRITDLDPLRWGLLFERFLNPERVSMPDFDIDFCMERRDEVLHYVQDKYGHDRVAQIITFGKLQARAVLRDVGRVLQLPYSQVDRICKLVPNNPTNPVRLLDAIAGDPALQEHRDSDPAVARMMDIGIKLEGLYRHASTHAAGVVISDRPLTELVPLFRDQRSAMPATQFNMKWVESAGLVKFDFLGLKTLTVLARVERLLAERDIAIDLARLPLDDRATYEMLGRGETVGVFQLESAGMRDVLRKLQADRFEDIIAVVALYRPGPMDNIPSYINRKHGREAPDYLYPSLEGILKETFGIMIYQEQVMQIAQELAGYSLGNADLLRRAMGKKIPAEMEAQRKTFIEGAKARGVPAATAAHIFELVFKFAGYGFNKSHAAAYAMVAYQTAYLKANHPVEFLAASMTYDMGNTDKLNAFRQELDRLGIALLPPDINHSEALFTVEAQDGGRGAVRYALGALKNVGTAAMDVVVSERRASGRFASLADFADRVDARAINRRQLESLVCAGAFDGLEPNRHRLFQGIDTLLGHVAASTEDRHSAQASLFGEAGSAKVGHRLALPEVEDWPAMDRLKREFEAIGFYLSAHPLEAYASTLERLGVVPHAELARKVAEDPFSRRKLAGIVAGKQERRSAKGNRYAFVQVSDTSGLYEVVLFSEVLAAARDHLEVGNPVLITVDARPGDDGLRLNALAVQPLEEAVAHAAAGMRVFMAQPSALPVLKSVVEREGTGRGVISLVLTLEDGSEVDVELPGGYNLTGPVRAAVKGIPGIMVQDL